MHNASSPDNSDHGIERQIQAKGKTAPRVTPEALKAHIKHIHFFTAFQGAMAELGSDGVPPTVYEQDVAAPLRLLTICVITMQNGFTVLGQSACASPENFDADIGKNIAQQNAENEMWPLLGYALKEKLHAQVS